MLRNYLKIALRNLWRNKTYSAINFLGLSVGISVSLLIMLFVFHELNFDQFHKKYQLIFKAKGEIKYGGQPIYMETFSGATAAAIKNETTEAVESVRLYAQNHVIMSRENEKKQVFYEEKFLFADPSFLSVFSFKLIEGNAETALSEPNKMLITPEMAKKYFGNQSPVGKTLVYHSNGGLDYSGKKPVTIPSESYIFEITGIIEPAPSYSTIQYNFVTSFSSLAAIDKNGYTFDKPALGGYEYYFLLKNDKSVANVEKALNKLVIPAMADMKQHFTLIALKNIHFSHTDKTNIYIFLVISFIILLLALINYMSLTTARSAIRAKEVGIRKVVGAGRGQLVSQFFGESIVFILLSFLIALLLMQAMLPAFYDLVQVHIPLSFLWNPQFIIFVCVVLITSGLLAGSYPALLLSRFIPIDVLKGKLVSGQGVVGLRRFFIVFQFSVSIILIICSLIIQRQLDFIRKKDLGLNKEQMLVIPVSASIGKKYLSLKNELKAQTGVINVAASTSVPFNPEGTNIMFIETLDKKQISLHYTNIDEDFLKTYNIKWKEKLPEAEFFDKIQGKVILNEAAVEQMNLKNPLGKKISFSNRTPEVAGIVRNFNFMSLQTNVPPMLMSPVKDTAGQLMIMNGYLSVQLDIKADVSQKLIDFARIYKTYEAEKPFEYFFLDETFNRLYKSEDRLANTFKIFTVFSVFIACLGLFGLVTFIAERRTKEIGIRKVFGASVADIVTLLSKEFIWLVLVSNAIAVPLAWYFMHKWIQAYPFRINLSWWIFALSGSMALLIAVLTVSFQAIKSALANPVKSLRTE